MSFTLKNLKLNFCLHNLWEVLEYLSSFVDKLELPNQVTRNDVAFQVTNSKVFIEIPLSSY